MKDPAKHNEDSIEYHERRAEEAPPGSESAEFHQERADDRRGLATTYTNKAKLVLDKNGKFILHDK